MRLLPKLVSTLALAAVLASCDARFGNDAPVVSENATAAGRAEEGLITVEAPGFNLSVDVPDSVEAQARVGEDSGLIYPGSNFDGMHIQGRPGRDGEDGGGEVEMRFTSGDAPERIAAWYRDPARAQKLTIDSARRDGAAVVIEGTGRQDNERFTVCIAPRAGGGSEARLVLADSR